MTFSASRSSSPTRTRPHHPHARKSAKKFQFFWNGRNSGPRRHHGRWQRDRRRVEPDRRRRRRSRWRRSSSFSRRRKTVGSWSSAWSQPRQWKWLLQRNRPGVSLIKRFFFFVADAAAEKKLEHLSLTSFLCLVLCVRVRQGYAGVEHLPFVPRIARKH